MDSRIILPLDHVQWDQAEDIMRRTEGLVWGYKIRRSVLDRGLTVLPDIKRYGRVMLDFKLYDIPSAMTESLRLHMTAGADITTVHCTSGYNPDAHGLTKDHIAGVTILTSMSRADFRRYYRGESLQQMVAQMATEAVSRYAYLVCSAMDLELIHALDIRKICPGIRPSWYREDDDQHRTATPADAIRKGADLLVIGRPLLGAVDIADAVERTNAEIAQALSTG
ncbi:MAG: orotidine 5'-phosphate decarboxylase / HUMPS family protein [Desulfobacterales bacterium]